MEKDEQNTHEPKTEAETLQKPDVPKINANFSEEMAGMFRALHEESKELKSQAKEIGIAFQKLEDRMDKASNKMMSLTSIIVAVVFSVAILIAIDYFWNNEQRYEKFIDKTEEIKENFYSKTDIDKKLFNTVTNDQLQSLINDNNRNYNVLSCLASKKNFSSLCFNQPIFSN
jgi:hypothetical protein